MIGATFLNRGQGRVIAAVAALLAFMLAVDLFSAARASLTYDEPDHLRYGLQLLDGDAGRFDDSKMPFSALNALPRHLARGMEAGPWRDELARPKAGRYATIVFALLVGLYVFRWAALWWGNASGLLALALFVLSPNIVAHARLTTTDLYGAGMILIALYHFAGWMEHGGRTRLSLAALTCGLAQIAKYTSAYLLPILLLIGLLRSLAPDRRPRDRRAAVRLGLRGTAATIVFLVIALLVINLGFLFEGSGTPLSDYSLRSGLLQGLCEGIGPLADVPLPVPYPWLEGLDWVKAKDESWTYCNLYLHGELRNGHGFLGYFLAVGLYKMPLPVLGLVCAALWLVVRRRVTFWSRELYLLVPILFFVAYFNLLFDAQLGFRFALVVLPLLHVLCGGLVAHWRQLGGLARGALVTSLAWLLVSFLSWFPHYLPYCNELLLDRSQAYRLFADSNVSWGQGYRAMLDYLRRNPEVVPFPETPCKGRILVEVNQLVGTFDPFRAPWCVDRFPRRIRARGSEDVDRYRWLREGHRPVDHVAYCYLIFDVR